MTAGYNDLDNVPSQTPGSSPVLASDWNTYVRDNFDQIKFGHVVVASVSVLPSASEGTMAYVSDVNKVFVFNGSAWCEIFDLDNVVSVGSTPTLRTVPVGVINPYVGASVPDGWLFCDGGNGSGSGSGTLDASVGTVYSDLWVLLSGASFSGIGSRSAMTLPDLRGRVLVGKGSHVDVDTLGEADAAAVANRSPKHKHTSGLTATSGGIDHTHSYYVQPGYTTAVSGGSGIPRAYDNQAASGGYYGNTGGSSAYLHTHPVTGTVGVGSGTDDTMPYIVTNYIIKV